MEVLMNITELYSFLSPILTSVEDSRWTIKFYRGDDDPEEEAQAEAHDSKCEEEEEIDFESEKEEDSQEEEDTKPEPRPTNRKQVHFSQSHLS